MSFQKDMEVFRELVKESAANKEKNLKRFSSRNLDSEQDQFTETDPVTDPESDPQNYQTGEKDRAGRFQVEKSSGQNFEEGNFGTPKATRRVPDQEGRASEPVAFPKEKRRAQIDLGHLVIDYFKEEPFVVKDPVKRTGPGRPRKPKSEQVKTIAIKIRPEYIDLLKNLSFGRGMGTRIRMIIDQWNSLKKREKEQVLVLKRAISELDGAIKKYARNYNRAENLERNEVTIKGMEKACNNIKILMNVLRFEVGEMEGFLSKDEFKNLSFAYHYKSGNEK